MEEIVDRYLQDITNQGYPINQQGIWIQSPWVTFGSNRGTIPAPAASLTKVATTIASLQTWDFKSSFLDQVFNHRGNTRRNIKR